MYVGYWSLIFCVLIHQTIPLKHLIYLITLIFYQIFLGINQITLKFHVTTHAQESSFFFQTHCLFVILPDNYVFIPIFVNNKILIWKSFLFVYFVNLTACCEMVGSLLLSMANCLAHNIISAIYYSGGDRRIHAHPVFPQIIWGNR